MLRRKNQIQALDRSEPGMPLQHGKVATQTDDFKRQGTTTLFAALYIADGKVSAPVKTPPPSEVDEVPAPDRREPPAR